MIAYLRLQAVPNQQFSATLGGQKCAIRLIQRRGKMYATLYVAGAEVFSGMLVHDRLPWIQTRGAGFSGNLVVVDLDGYDDPQYAGLSARYKLYYYNDEELPDWFQTPIIDLEGV